MSWVPPGAHLAQGTGLLLVSTRRGPRAAHFRLLGPVGPPGSPPAAVRVRVKTCFSYVQPLPARPWRHVASPTHSFSQFRRSPPNRLAVRQWAVIGILPSPDRGPRLWPP